MLQYQLTDFPGIEDHEPYRFMRNAGHTPVVFAGGCKVGIFNRDGDQFCETLMSPELDPPEGRVSEGGAIAVTAGNHSIAGGSTLHWGGGMASQIFGLGKGYPETRELGRAFWWQCSPRSESRGRW